MSSLPMTPELRAKLVGLMLAQADINGLVEGWHISKIVPDGFYVTLEGSRMTDHYHIERKDERCVLLAEFGGIRWASGAERETGRCNACETYE